MKSMFEYMTTMIITMILVFMFSIVISIGSQILNARLIHSMAIDNIEASYYNFDPNSLLNDDLFSKWSFDTPIEIESVNTRKTYLVTLNYQIDIPLVNTAIDNLKIEGYAR